MLEDLQVRHYSPTTIRIYLHSVAEFAHHFREPLDQLGLRRSARFVSSTHTLSQEIAIERIPFPPRERKLPMILSRQEVKALLEAPRTLRHRALLAVLYGLVR
jgi:site-specific recombinase XerD